MFSGQQKMTWGCPLLTPIGVGDRDAPSFKRRGALCFPSMGTALAEPGDERLARILRPASDLQPSPAKRGIDSPSTASLMRFMPKRTYALLLAAGTICLAPTALRADRAELVHPKITVLVDDLKFTEGPVWDKEAGGIIFSDIDLETEYRWSEEEGLRLFRENTNKANGHAFDPQGRLITCEGGAHRVTRRELDGSYTVLADSFEGVRLNVPNDVVVRSDGNIYFTDPNYGYPEGRERQFVYRIRPDGILEKALPASFNKPNGIALSPDEATLYLNVGSDHMTLAYPLKKDGAVVDHSRRVADGLDRGADGMAVHPETGDVFIALYWNNRRKPDEQGLNVFSPEGKYKGIIPIPGNTTNACFGPEGDVLYVTSSGNLFRVDLGEDYRGQRSPPPGDGVPP